MTNENLETRLKQSRPHWTEVDTAETCARSVEYDDQVKMLVVAFDSGSNLLFPICLLEGLADASPDKVSAFHLSEDGRNLRWESLDIDFSIPELIDGCFGSEAWIRKLKETPDPMLTLKRKLTASQTLGNQDEAHRQADSALLSYIDNEEVSDLFDSIGKWYS